MDFSPLDLAMMELALKEAQKAAEAGDVPVGAVLCLGEEILAKAKNEREARQDATAHAEILAIRQASQALQTWHLEATTLYVTLEPCPMCAGAILNSRIARVVFGAYQTKTGALASKTRLYDLDWPGKPQWQAGLLATESQELLQAFFQERRRQASQLGGPGARRAATLKNWLDRTERCSDER
ncbi:MAG: nucleoside deaminase [Eubacteriales bacterium]|nr:nucleoside deaminase [Clostridiales bacterium]MDY5836283.1 nucleoside deaminase [Eubacteriales bacterium]